VSWDAVDGLTLYVDGRRVDQRIVGVTNRESYDVDAAFYVGRSTSDMSRRHYASAVFDDVQLWEAKRDYLISLNLIRPGLSNLRLYYTCCNMFFVRLTLSLIHVKAVIKFTWHVHSSRGMGEQNIPLGCEKLV